MATRWCDHGAYAAYAAIPTWGVPQEGDGLAKAVAAAASIAAISFSAPPTSGVITVFGVTITLTSVLSQASANVAADNLATSINAMQTVVAASVSSSTPQLRNLVYARGPSAGAPAGTCQIMTRVGAVSLNHPNANCLITTTFNNVSSSAGSHQFSGGVSGCYGYWYNNTAVIWPQAIVGMGYGLFSSTLQPLAGVPEAGDYVKIRSNKTLTLYGAIVANISIKSNGTALNPVIYDFDDGTEWPADGFEPLFVMLPIVNVGGAFTVGSSTGINIVKGKRYTNGNSVIFRQAGNGTLNTGLTINIAAMPGRMEYWTFDWATSGTGGLILAGSSQAVLSQQSYWLGCEFAHARNSSFIALGSNAFGVTLDRCIFNNSGSVGANIVGIISSNTTTTGLFYLIAPVFTGFIVGSQLLSVGPLVSTSASSLLNIVLKDPTWGNVSARGPYLAASTFPIFISRMHTMFASGSVGAQEMVLDTKQGFMEWNASRAQPTLNAKLRDGVTPMSWRFVPTTNAASVSFMVPFELPQLVRINELPTAQRTFTFEFCIEQSLSFHNGNIWPFIEYTLADGSVYTIDGYDPTNSALTPSTAAWSNLVGGQVTYVDGGTIYHNRFKRVITTPAGKNPALGCEIVVTWRIAGSAANLTQGGFIDPEYTLS
jgi:hypothetical protein